jgi:hypothetical protein
VDLKEKMMGQPLKKDEERSICGSEIWMNILPLTISDLSHRYIQLIK